MRRVPQIAPQIARQLARQFVSATLLFAAAALLIPAAHAATSPSRAQRRLPDIIDDASPVTLPGSRQPLATAANDIGAIPDNTQLEGMTLVFNRTPAQEADLQALLAAQVDPASPLFHQWLTPAQYGARFGLADADITAAQTWLTSHGFTLASVSPSRTQISFSGTAGQFAQAFHAPLHSFRVTTQAEGTKVHFAPADDLSLPAALAGSIAGVTHISDFRPHNFAQRPAPGFTSTVSGGHFTTPADLATIYDFNSVYNAGYTGTGVAIAIIGQSAVVNSDITTFQTAAGVPVRAPTSILVPGTGTSTIYTGDQSESDLDLEYSSGVAKGSTIYFVYTGSGNFGAYDSLNYAIQQDIAPIVSLSYGTCEPVLAASVFSSVEQSLQQAAAQGQTVIVSSGDDGSTACNEFSSLTTAQKQTLSVNYPASSAYAVAMGGTEFTPAAVAVCNNTYYTAPTGSSCNGSTFVGSGSPDVISSAVSYIPEQVWNDDSSTGLGATGGGPSAKVARPSYQAGVPGIPSGSQRLLPDIALQSSASEAGYLFCSNDSSNNITGSCTTGFRAANGTSLTVAGGTSFAAPVFAGMLALLNQAKGYTSTGQGQVNTVLYSLASNAATYASAFHDITSGSNACANYTSICNSANSTSFAATTGYDQATGLGSLDLANLIRAWPAKSAALLTTSTTVSATTTNPAVGATDTITVTVSGGATGSANVIVNGVVHPVTLTAGTGTYSFPTTISGTYNVNATYAGDAAHSASNSSLIMVTVAGSFTVGASATSVTHGSTVSVPVSVTPVSGYTGTVTFTATAPSTLTYTCYTIANVAVTGTTASSSLVINTGASTCTGGSTALSRTGTGAIRRAANATPVSPARSLRAASVTLAGFLLVMGFGLRRRRVLPIALALVFSTVAFGVSGCSGSGGTSGTSPTPVSTTTSAPTGSYAVTVTGADTVTGTLVSTTTFTLTVN